MSEQGGRGRLPWYLICEACKKTKGRFKLAICGHLFCSSCVQSNSEKCPLHQKRVRLLPVEHPNVTSYFRKSSETLEPLSRAMQFQSDLIESRMRNLSAEERKIQEVTKKNLTALLEIRNKFRVTKQRIAQLKRHLMKHGYQRPKQPSSRNYRGRDRHSRAVGEVPMRRDFPQWSDMSESNENVSCPSPFERMHSRDRSQLRTPKRQTDADAPPRARHSSDESDLMFKIVGRPNRKQPSSEPVRYRTPTDHLIDGASVRDSVQRRQDGERTSSKVPDPTFENAPTKDCDGPLKRKFGILPKSV